MAAEKRLVPKGTVRKGCICPFPAQLPEGGYDWKIDPECPYHALAAEYPEDHSIPWNCPTYWDGCNCDAPVDCNHEPMWPEVTRPKCRFLLPHRWEEALCDCGYCIQGTCKRCGSVYYAYG